jgi:hypothetical protein
MQDIQLNDTTLISFNTQRVGKKDAKKDGGVHRGRHTVRVTMLVGADYQTVSSLDWTKSMMADPNKYDYMEKIKDRNPDFEFDKLSFSVAWDDVIISLQDTAHGEVEDKRNKHLEAYEPHPCGIRGVMVHKENGGVYLTGILVKEEILERDPNGDQKLSKRSPKSQLKREIQKELDLMTGKWRQYKLPIGTTINGIDHN